jgi:hypothetical protein
MKAKKREVLLHLSREKKIANQERIYNLHLGPPLSRAFLVGFRKVYSVRCEADVVMTSVIRR